MYHYRNPPQFDDSTEDDKTTSYHNDTETEEQMEGDSAPVISTTTTTENKKKLKTPTPFSGKRDDLRKFLQEIKLYLLGNEQNYTTEQDKVLFVLSYMNEGDANSWKEEFVETAEQKAAQEKTNLNLGNYDDLITEIMKDFSPYDAPKDAIFAMKEMQMGSTPIEEHVAKFKMLVTRSKLDKNDAVVEYFRETLPISLMKNILNLPEPPTTLDKWYETAIKSHNNYLRMRSAIARTQNKGGNTTSNWNKTKATNREPRKFYFEPKQKDPNAMDIDYINANERTALMKKGACFICRTIGHLARDCLKKKKKDGPPNYTPPQKMKGRELTAHVRTLLAEMNDEDKEEFFDNAAKEGF